MNPLQYGVARLLSEPDVINAVVKMLRAKGYDILQELSTRQQGDDIIAIKKGRNPRKLYVEAKGGTSSDQNSARYGRPFNSSQVRTHVAEALYKAVEVLSRTNKDTEVRAAIAVPDTQGHRRRIKVIAAVLDPLGIAVFWVQETGSVQVAASWKL